MGRARGVSEREVSERVEKVSEGLIGHEFAAGAGGMKPPVFLPYVHLAGVHIPPEAELRIGGGSSGGDGGGVKFVPGPGPISPPRDTYYGTSTYTALGSRTPFTYACGSCVRVGFVLGQRIAVPR